MLTIGEKRDYIGAINLESYFQKIPIITPKKQTVQPGDANKGTALNPGFEIVKF
jgi:hypothetical protein